MSWIKGFVGLSMIEYPGKIAAALFLAGCPFRCPFCHNADLVLDPAALPGLDEEDVLMRLGERAGFCDGVVISGGEPLMYPKLESLLRRIKEMGFLIKLDTNGYYPETLNYLVEEKLPDFISMDLKSSLKRYHQACGVHVDWWRLERSISILNRGAVAHEFRTTLVPGLVGLEDIEEMAMTIGIDSPWVLQSFRPVSTLDPAYRRLTPYSDDEMVKIFKLASSLKPFVTMRHDFNPTQKRFNQKAISIGA